MQSHLRAVRESAGLTAAALVRKSGLSDTTIRRAERGRVVTPVTLNRIVNALNDLVPPDRRVQLRDVFPDAEPSKGV